MSATLLVADSGPLIALARLDLLWLPAHFFREVLVTGAVWGEIVGEPGRAEHPFLVAARRDGAFRVVDDPIELPSSLAGARLDLGERSAIALALESGAAVLVDEKRGRAAATALGLPVVGTLGILARARDAALVPNVRPLTDALVRSGYHLSPQLVTHLLAVIGE
jgi:predicted nucleic acid-binding protein